MRAMIVYGVLFAMVGCGGEDGDGTTADLTDEERADDLWAELSGHESWGQVDPWVGIQTSAPSSPHGPYAQIWLDDAASGSADSGTFADGSILVKHLYDDADEATDQGLVVAMQKIEGYGSTDWFWAIYDSAGVADPYGDVAMCADCHVGGQDYAWSLTEAPGM